MDNNILLVEDNQKHAEDAKRILDQYKIMHDHCSNLTEALGFFREHKASGILSDVFFPLSELGIERPSGVILCEYALEQKIPIVLCTSTYHHGPKTSQVNRYARRQGIPLIDSEEVTGDEEANEKNWKEAVLELIIQQAIMKNITFSSQRERLNALVLEGVFEYSEDNLVYRTCKKQIAEEVIDSIKKEYPILSLGNRSVDWDILMKLPNFAENHGACRPYHVDLVRNGEQE